LDGIVGTSNARLALIVTFIALAIGCSGSSSPTPTSPGTGPGPSANPSPSGTCRTFAANATGIDDATPSITATVTGAFNSSTRQFTATAGSVQTGVCSTVVFNYNSIADFVNEVGVVPPRALVTQSTSTSGPGCGSAAITSTITYSYDAQRRLTQAVQGGQTITYTAWDSAGRPTAGNSTGGMSISHVYVDAARTDTVTTISNSSTTTVRLTYDANGILLSEVYLTGPSHTVTWTTASTNMVCS
jgi:YD repeat-containing protein